MFIIIIIIIIIISIIIISSIIIIINNLLEVYSYQPSWEQPISYVRCCVSEPRGVVET